MIISALGTLLLIAALLRGLQHQFYALHLMLVGAACWWLVPAFQPIWHPSYPFYIGGIHLISINLVAFAAYGWDKRQARHRGWRIPEKTLHALAFIGGTLGAYAGSKFFRHKTIKGQFRQMFQLVLGVQILAVGVVVWLHFSGILGTIGR